jgi:rRNA small subunit pseudouridine methyltransferase Nep1
MRGEKMDKSTLYFILAESALEPIPTEFKNHPKLQRYAKKQKKSPESIIFDKSIHSFLINDPKGYEKRGRPDLVHISLLSILGTPLCKTGRLKLFVHTANDLIIQIDPNVRLPRNYTRFVGLMSQLFETGQVPPKGSSLLSIREMTLKELIEEIKPKYTILFSETGKEIELMKFMSRAVEYNPLAIIVGGFPHGKFSKETYQCANEIVAISDTTLDAHIVVSRVIYAYEIAMKTK